MKKSLLLVSALVSLGLAHNAMAKSFVCYYIATTPDVEVDMAEAIDFSTVTARSNGTKIVTLKTPDGADTIYALAQIAPTTTAGQTTADTEFMALVKFTAAGRTDSFILVHDSAMIGDYSDNTELSDLTNNLNISVSCSSTPNGATGDPTQEE